MNLGVFTGNLGRDAEVRYTKGGTAVLSFSIAVKHGYGDNSGTMWVSCALFGKRAEGKVVEYLTKGQQVVVSGEVSLNEYQNSEGQTKTKLQLKVDNLDLVGGKAAGGTNTKQQAPKASDTDFNQDIPF